MATTETKAATDQRQPETYGVLPPGAGPSFAPIGTEHSMTPATQAPATNAAAPATTSPHGIAAAPQQQPVTSYGETKEQPQDGSAPVMIPMVIPLQMLQGEMPMWIDCPFCSQRTLTQAKSEGTSMQV